MEESALADGLQSALAGTLATDSHHQARVSSSASTPAIVQEALPRESEEEGGGEHAAGEATLGKLQRAVEAIDLPRFQTCLQSLCAAAAGQWLLNSEDAGAAAASSVVVHIRREHAAGSVAGDAAVPPTRHELQAAAIVQAIQQAGLLPGRHSRTIAADGRHDDDDDAVLVIEAGAGSAALSEELVCAALDSAAAESAAADVMSTAVARDVAAATAPAAPTDAVSARPLPPLRCRLPPLRLLLLDRMGGIVRRDLAIMRALVAASGLPPWPGTAPSAKLGLGAGAAGSAGDDGHDAAAAAAHVALAGYAARAALLRACMSRVRIDLLDFSLAQHPAFADASADAAPPGKAWQMCDPVAHQAALRPPSHLAKLAAGISDAAGKAAGIEASDAAEAAADVAPAAKRARLSLPGRESAACADNSGSASAGGAAAMPSAPSSASASATIGSSDAAASPSSPSHSPVPRRSLLVAKHLCGAATDFALRSYAAALVGHAEVARLAGDCDAAAVSDCSDGPAGAGAFATAPAGGAAGADSHAAAAAADAVGVGLAGFGGVGLVTCCHHRCDWQPYVGKRFFRSAVAHDARLAGLLARVRAMGMAEAAAAAADAASVAAAAACAPPVASEASEAAVTAFVVLSLVSPWAGTFEKARARAKARASAGAGGDEGGAGLGGASSAAPTAAAEAGEAAAAAAPVGGAGAAAGASAAFANADKCEVGRACKLLIDAGRADFLRRVLQRAAEISSLKQSSRLGGPAGAGPTSASASVSAFCEAAGCAAPSFTVGVKYFCPSSWTPENRMLLAGPALPAHDHDDA